MKPHIDRMEALAAEGVIDAPDAHMSLEIVYRAFGYEDASQEDQSMHLGGAGMSWPLSVLHENHAWDRLMSAA